MRLNKDVVLTIIFTIMFFKITCALAQESWIATNGPNGGVVSSLVVDHKGRIYAGTLHGGMFISMDQGNSWKPINHGLPTREIRAIGLTPDGNVFLGTGKGYIFRSENRGREWILSASLPSEVHTMSVDGKRHLFAGTGGHGVFKLSNGETMWSQTGLNHVSVQCLAVGSNSELYAATNLGLFKSTDEWDTWQIMDIPDIYIFSLATDFNGQLFAGTWGGKVYRSQNKGKSWTRFNVGLRNSIIWSISISRKGDIFVGAYGAGLFRSGDGGTTWESVNDGLTDLMVRSIAVSSDGEIFVGTSSGLVFKGSESTFSYSSGNAYSLCSCLLELPMIERRIHHETIDR